MGILILGIIAAVIILFLFISLIDTNRFVVRHYELKSCKVKKDISIAVISDLHNKSYGKNNQVLLDKIDKLHPDYVFMTGDILTGRKNAGFEHAADFVKRTAQKYPVIYANGNHEQRLRTLLCQPGKNYHEYLEQLDMAGVHPLINESADLSDYGITVYGTEIEKHYYQKFHRVTMEDDYLKQKLGTPNPQHFNILLAHNPDFFETYAKWNPDLVLSGHVHGGIMRLPVLGGVIAPTYRLFPKYDGGLYREKESVMILSRGLGTHTLPLRIWNPGELLIITIKKTKEK